MGRVPDGQYLKGVADTSTRLGELMNHMEGATPAGMKLACLDVQQRAMEKAPVDTGTMVGTSYTQVEVQGDVVVGEVHFPAKYAGRQHEDVSLHHPHGGEAKFLEKAMLEKEGQIKAQVAAMIAAAFGGG